MGMFHFRQGLPPARPFDSAQGERPHPGIDSRSTKGELTARRICDQLGGRNDGEERGGGRFGGYGWG